MNVGRQLLTGWWPLLLTSPNKPKTTPCADKESNVGGHLMVGNQSTSWHKCDFDPITLNCYGRCCVSWMLECRQGSISIHEISEQDLPVKDVVAIILQSDFSCRVTCDFRSRKKIRVTYSYLLSRALNLPLDITVATENIFFGVCFIYTTLS